jgi:hypothetical protein
VVIEHINAKIKTFKIIAEDISWECLSFVVSLISNYVFNGGCRTNLIYYFLFHINLSLLLNQRN